MVPGKVSPWEKPGWFRKTTDEACSRLAHLGYKVTSSFEQLRVIGRTTVIRVNTTKGRVYLKASSRKEGGAVQCVSQFAPYLVPKPLYVHAEEGWYLTEDYGPTLYENISYEDFKNWLELYGRMQVASMEHIPELLRAGVPEVAGDVIYERTKRMLEDDRVREMLGGIDGFAPVASDGRADLSKYDEAVCVFLKHLYEEWNAPRALGQGDFFDDNLIKMDVPRADGNRYVLLDWEHANIDIPYNQRGDSVYFSVVFTCEQDEPFRNDYNTTMSRCYDLWAKYVAREDFLEKDKLLNWKDGLIFDLERYEDPESIAPDKVSLFTEQPVMEGLVKHLRWILEWSQSRGGK